MAASESSCFTINEGSTFRVQFNWRDADGNALDFTGFTVGIYDADTGLEGLTATLLDPATALTELSMIDTSAIKEARRKAFRIGYTRPNGDVQTTNKLYIAAV